MRKNKIRIRRVISFIMVVAMLCGSGVFQVFAATEYAKYISSFEDDQATGHMDQFSLWSGCGFKVKNETQTQHKFDGAKGLRLYCPENKMPEGTEWHASYYWDLDPKTNGNWTGAQYIEFWIKNATGHKLPLQLQFIEYGKSGAVDGEPWRIKVKTKVWYEENGKLVERDSDVSSAEDYNEFGNDKEGAIEIPAEYEGLIRVAINSNNFRRSEWYIDKPGSGSNNVIDKGKIAQFGFTYDPRIVDPDKSFYLDSFRLISPNSNMPGSMEYQKLLDSIKPTTSGSTNPPKSTTTAKTGDKPATTTKALDGQTTTTDKDSPEKTNAPNSDETNTMDSKADTPSGHENGGVSGFGDVIEGQTTKSDKKDDAKKSNTAIIVISIIGIVVVIGGGLLFIFRDKIFKKKDTDNSFN